MVRSLFHPWLNLPPPCSEVGGTGKVSLGVAMPDVCTSVFHQQETGEGEMFLSFLRGWAVAWPAPGHLAGVEAPPRPGGRSCVWDSGFCPQGKQPRCQQGCVPPLLLWLTLLHMHGVGGAAEWGGAQEPQEDTDPDLG